MNARGHELLGKFAKLADELTDSDFADAVKEAMRCGVPKCPICKTNLQMLEVVRRLREIRRKEHIGPNRV